MELSSETIDHAEKFKNGNSDFIQNLNSWKKELDDIKLIMLNSPYKGYVPDFKMTITEKAYPEVDNVNSMMTTNMNTPTSITLDQNIATNNMDDFLNKVEKLEIDIENELSDLLLSINPVTNHGAADRIKALFEDPAFQLN